MRGTNCTKTCNSLCRSCRRRGALIHFKDNVFSFSHDHMIRQQWPCLPLYVFLLSISRSASNSFCSDLFRDSLAAQLEITLTKADSEQLARSIAEEQYSDLEKEKIMKELELKEMMARHRQELAEKDITISSVRGVGCRVALCVFSPDDLKGFSLTGVNSQAA